MHNSVVARIGVAAMPFLVSMAAAGQPARDHDLEPEDYFSIGVITGVAASTDGTRYAYTESRWDPPAEKRNTDVWVVDAKTRSTTRLTFDKASDRSPEWSPDGKYVYFTSNRQRGEDEDPPYNGKTQVWRVLAKGGTPVAVTRVKNGIELFDLSSDGKTLYYTVADEQLDEEWKSLREKYKDLDYGHGKTEFSQLWKLDLKNWRSEKLADERRVIRTLAVSPDEQRIAMLTTPDEELIVNEGWSRVDVFDADSGEVTTVTPSDWRKDDPSPFGWLDGLDWSADGRALAFSIDFDGYPAELYVVHWTGQGTSLRKLPRPQGVSLVSGSAKWRGKTRQLCFIGDERARQRVYCIADVGDDSQGESYTMTTGDVAVSSFDFPTSGVPLVLVMSTKEALRDVHRMAKPGHYTVMTNVNPQVATWKLPRISLVSWTGAEGDEVEGILELPPDYKPGDDPLPLVVELHGGPTASTKYTLRFWIYGRALMAAKGYALLSPNYRGSTGYGDKFMTDLIGRENDIEVEDILKGVDAMIERGIADPDRIGVMGWSNGGFLTNALITKSDRFKAASSGAGVLDMVIQWGTEDTPGHVVNFMEGLPWSDPESYRKGSPIYGLDKVCTPTIIHVGGSDARVPAANSRALYRALRHYLDVPVELVVYPGEGHGLTTYQNRKAKMEWDLAWFDRYLLGKKSEETNKESEG